MPRGGISLWIFAALSLLPGLARSRLYTIPSITEVTLFATAWILVAYWNRHSPDYAWTRIGILIYLQLVCMCLVRSWLFP